MQKGLTGKRPVQILQAASSTSPLDSRQVVIFNNSAVQLYLGDDQASAIINNGVPIPAGVDKTFFWNGELWIGADADNTEFRYMISPHFSGATSSFEELRAKTPPPSKYFNRPVGR